MHALMDLPLVTGDPWLPRIEVNPADAKEMGIKEGQVVVVETTSGQRSLHVRIHAGTRPGTLGLPLGHGAWPPRAGGEPTGGYGLVANVSDPLAGILSLQSTRARVRRAT